LFTRRNDDIRSEATSLPFGRSKGKESAIFHPLPPSKEDVGHYNQRTNNQRWN